MDFNRETNYDRYAHQPLLAALAAYNEDFARVGTTGTFHDWLAQTVDYVEYDPHAALGGVD